MTARCEILGCFAPATWTGWMPKPGCPARVLVPRRVCARHQTRLIARGLCRPEPLTREEEVPR